GALEAIARAQTVSDRPVEADVEAPDEGTDQVRDADHARSGKREQHYRSPEAVERVVERHRARMDLTAREPGTGPGEQGEVGADPEHAELPVPGPVPHDLEDDRHDGEQRE